MADTFQIRQDEPGCAEDANALLERFRRATSALVRIYTSTASGCGVLVRVHDMICIVTAAHCRKDRAAPWQLKTLYDKYRSALEFHKAQLQRYRLRDKEGIDFANVLFPPPQQL